MRSGISFQVAYAISRPGIKPASPNIGCRPAMEGYLKTVEPRFLSASRLPNTRYEAVLPYRSLNLVKPATE